METLEAGRVSGGNSAEVRSVPMRNGNWKRRWIGKRRRLIVRSVPMRNGNREGLGAAWEGI
ncbi:protein of unknown function [Kyrpidia spormannii]|uniref:Uncharacterized protein n=1 Tax=Kyrpidia spormannii TaxID=2055160 RepID=A0A6F9EFB0_9BACL|nr:protein of unknown function [Kyrpidia spormannii]